MYSKDEEIRPGELHRGKICAVVITYNPGPGFQQRLQLVANQVTRTVIVDNGSTRSVLAMLHSLSNEMNVELILNHENLGVSHALNQGVTWASLNRFEWILTMDQDSVVKNNMIERLSEIFNYLHPKNSIGVIGSNYCDQYGRYWKPKIKTDFPWVERPVVITSGSLISIRACLAVGGFCDDLFIDQVDHDYCIRLRKQGYMVCKSTEPLMTHTIGNITRQQFFGVYLYTTNHKAFRRYYIARNRIVLAKKYFLTEPIFVICELYRMIGEIVAIVLLEKEKTQKLRAITIGLLHGITGRMGQVRV